jgi:hypothetical protein
MCHFLSGRANFPAHTYIMLNETFSKHNGSSPYQSIMRQRVGDVADTRLAEGYQLNFRRWNVCFLHDRRRRQRGQRCAQGVARDLNCVFTFIPKKHNLRTQTP